LPQFELPWRRQLRQVPVVAVVVMVVVVIPGTGSNGGSIL
jgi:hypothetical protein